MPRYFFDVHDGGHLPDQEGVEFDNLDDVRKEVWTTLPTLAAHRKADGHMACQLRMDVREESGKHVFHAALTLVIEPAQN